MLRPLPVPTQVAPSSWNIEDMLLEGRSRFPGPAVICLVVPSDVSTITIPRSSVATQSSPCCRELLTSICSCFSNDGSQGSLTVRNCNRSATHINSYIPCPAMSAYVFDSVIRRSSTSTFPPDVCWQWEREILIRLRTGTPMESVRPSQTLPCSSSSKLWMFSSLSISAFGTSNSFVVLLNLERAAARRCYPQVACLRFSYSK